MRGLFIRILLNGLSLFVVDYLLEGFRIEGWEALLVVAVLLSVVNAFLLPILKILTFPINLITLGLWSLVLNFFLFWAVIGLVNGVYVDSIWWGVGAWALYSIMVALLGTFVKG